MALEGADKTIFEPMEAYGPNHLSEELKQCDEDIRELFYGTAGHWAGLPMLLQQLRRLNNNIERVFHT